MGFADSLFIQMPRSRDVAGTIFMYRSVIVHRVVSLPPKQLRAWLHQFRILRNKFLPVGPVWNTGMENRGIEKNTGIGCSIKRKTVGI